MQYLILIMFIDFSHFDRVEKNIRWKFFDYLDLRPCHSFQLGCSTGFHHQNNGFLPDGIIRYLFGKYVD